MQKIFSFALETACAIRHHTFSLSCSDLAAEISLARLAELAFLAFWCAKDDCQYSSWEKLPDDILKRYDMVSRFDICDAFTN